MYLNHITFNNNFFITHNDALKVKRFYYDKKKNSIIINFNRALDIRSIAKTSNVKRSFKGVRIPTYKVNLIKPRTVEVKFKKKYTDFLNEHNISDEALFNLKIKNF